MVMLLGLKQRKEETLFDFSHMVHLRHTGSPPIPRDSNFYDGPQAYLFFFFIIGREATDDSPRDPPKN